MKSCFERTLTDKVSLGQYLIFECHRKFREAASNLLKIARSHQLAKMEGDGEIIKFGQIWSCSIFIPNCIKFSIYQRFSLEHTWPQFGRLSDIQLSTHLLAEA